MQHILVVDDSPDVLDILRTDLGTSFAVTCAESAEQAKRELARWNFALIVLDVSLPDADGYDLCRYLRGVNATSALPIIFLTGRAGLDDKLRGFSAGADDYVVKPFETVELKARIDAKLVAAQRVSGGSSALMAAGLRLEPMRQKVYLDEGSGERQLDLTGYEYKILAHFMAQRGRIVTRREILETVWGSVNVLDRTVDRHISNLRQKLGSHAALIRSRSGEGYVFDDAQALARDMRLSS